MRSWIVNKWVVLLAIGILGIDRGFADEAAMRELSEVYLRSDEETAALAKTLLNEQPGRLTRAERVAAHAYLCEALEGIDKADEAMADGDSASLLLPSHPDSEVAEPAARLLSCVGLLQRKKGHFAEALTDFNRAQAGLDPQTMWLTLSYVLYRRAGLNDALGDHAEALSDLTQAVELLSGHENDNDVEAQRNNIISGLARIYLHRKQFSQALGYYLDLLKYSEQVGDEHSQAVVEINLGDCFRGLQRWNEAAKAYGRALDISIRMHNQTMTGRAYLGQGAIASARGMYSEALAKLRAAHRSFVASNSRADLLDADFERAETLRGMHDWKAMLALTTGLLEQLGSTGDKRQSLHALELRARAEEGLGLPVAALADERQSLQLEREVNQMEREEELSKRSIQFEVARLADKASLLERENEIAQMRVAHEHEINLWQRAMIVGVTILVLLLANHIVRHWRASKILRKLASEDSLTGLSNRRETMAAARRAFSASLAHESPLSLAIIDVDSFKRINDQFGHGVGDDVLVAVAGCLKNHLRGHDVCGRIGGEEFLLLLPGCDVVHALTTLERLRGAVAEMCFAHSEALRTTISAGLVVRTTQDVDIEALARRADTALYAAKHAGRNRVVLHKPIEDSEHPSRRLSINTQLRTRQLVSGAGLDALARRQY